MRAWSSTDMTYHHEMTPNGRAYRRHDGTLWTIELEVGCAVWLKSDSGQVITARADQLNGAEWERIA